jgi:hypothetical protein
LLQLCLGLKCKLPGGGLMRQTSLVGPWLINGEGGFRPVAELCRF